MIRMGRGNRPEPSSAPDFQSQKPETSYGYTPEPQQAASRGAISESDSMARDIKEGRLSGFVGHGTTLTGETEFHAMLRVDGHLVGSVTSQAGTLIVGTNGQVDANVIVAAAMINGTVNGDIIATEKLQLGRTARVLGNIHSPRLVVEEGAILEGSCSMLKARETQEEEAATVEEEQYSQPELTPLATASDDEEDPAAYLRVDEDEEESAGAASV